MRGINLNEEERIQHKTKPSRWRYFWLYMFGWLILPLLRIYISRKTTVYYVTDRRVVRADGYLSLKTNEFRIEDIRQVETQATALGRMLNVGNIDLETYSQGEMQLVGVPNYRDVAETVRDGLMQE